MNKIKLIVKQNTNGIFVKKNAVFHKVCNFNAEITAEEVFKRLDGTAERHLKIKASLNGDEHVFVVPYAQFIDQSWVGLHLGLDAIVDGKVVNRNEFNIIINKLSRNKIKTTQIQKLGFYEQDGMLYFLHNGGAISANGFENVNLKASVEGTLHNCEIPPLADDDDAQSLVEDFLNLSDIAVNNKQIGTTLLAAVTRAPLTTLKLHKVSPAYVGDTGTGKTAIALIGQACYGAQFKDPPANWSSTAKSTELTAQEAANIFLLIDDYTAAMKNPETEKLAEYIIGGVSNSTVHGFALSSTKNADRPLIEAVTLLTAECIPEMTLSRKERCLFCSFSNGDVEITLLDEYQNRATSGDYAKTMGLFIVYVLKNHERIKNTIESIFKRYRSEATAELEGKLHSRAPSNVADLMLGIHFFLEFCFTEEYMSKRQARKIRDYHFMNLIDLIKQQPVLHENNDIKSQIKYKLSCFFSHGDFVFHKINDRKKSPTVNQYPDNFVGWKNTKDESFYILTNKTKYILDQLPEDLKNLMGSGEKSFWSSMKRYGFLAEIDIVAKKNVLGKQSIMKASEYILWITLYYIRFQILAVNRFF